MDDRIKKLNELNTSGQITDSEFKTLLLEILQSKSQDEEIVKGKVNEIIGNVSEAGLNVKGIYYCIVFEILLTIIFELLTDVKIKYYYRDLSEINIYQESNLFSKFILDMDNIDKIIEYLKYLNEIYYFFQLVIFSLFMHYLWNLGKKLKEPDWLK